MFKIRATNGKEYGPVDAGTVRLWIQQRRADGQTLVQPAEGGDWRPLADYAEFAPDLSSTPPPSGPPPLLRSSAPALAAPTPPKTSGLAIASLVAGFLGLCTLGIGSIVGIVLGVMALTRISRKPGMLRGRGFAIAGIIVSCVMGIALVVLGVLMPAISKSRPHRSQADCTTQLRQLAAAIRLYSADNSDMLPAATNWCDQIQPHLASTTAFVCPADAGGPPCSFGFNTRLSRREESQINPRTVLLFEMNGSWNASGGPESILSRHRNTYFVAFMDGSVETMSASKLGQLRWEP